MALEWEKLRRRLEGLENWREQARAGIGVLSEEEVESRKEMRRRTLAYREQARAGDEAWHEDVRAYTSKAARMKALIETLKRRRVP